jgi:predicted helicase
MAPSVTANADRIRQIKTFPSLVKYLRDELSWPIVADDFEDLTYDWEPEELGIDKASAAKIDEVKQLRPLASDQPWGIFFVKFEPKQLPVVALRRLLNSMVIRKRESANKSERQAWAMNDLMFISSYGDSGERHISFAHFSQPEGKNDLPTLKVLGWDNSDTPLHLDLVATKLAECLAWPEDEDDIDGWRDTWQSAFSLRHRETITTAKDLAIRLAALARAIRDRIATTLAIETDKGPLTKLMKAFQSALMHDLDDKGFADMYAQTIAYGLLSARIADPSSRTADDLTAHMKTNPFLKELMQTFLHVGGRKGKAGGPGIDFDELGVSEVVELLDDANMEAVVRDFGDKKRDEDPVMHFYESFLHEYNQQLKIQRGVFYTPQPVVSYIVRSVHELLQSEFGLADGLADITTWGEMLKKHPGMKLPPLTDGSGEKRTISPDEPFVQILDPATGTATFLVEVIDIIHATLKEKWKQQRLTESQQAKAWNDYVPKHLLPRLHAFELMMAPYAIAHMKIGLKLVETGYRFDADERARIYLTNALEPWQRQLNLPELDALAHEAAAVNEIKRNQRFTVVIGNPPYAGHSWNLTAELRKIIDPYRSISGQRIKEKGALQLEKSMQDDYIKFFRLGQSKIEQSAIGILGLVTSHGFLDNPSLRGMRFSIHASFNKSSFLDMHGNVLRQATSPDGTPDKNVFDIKDTGVAVSVLRKIPGQIDCSFEHAHLWGARDFKYPWLASKSVSNTSFLSILLREPQFLFIPQDTETVDEYEQWQSIGEAMPINSKGVVTGRDHFVLDFDEPQLLERMQEFAESKQSDAYLVERFRLNPTDWWRVEEARRQMPPVKDFRKYIRPMLYRPFDTRKCFYHPAVLMSPRRPVMQHIDTGHENMLLITSRMTKGEKFQHLLVSKGIAEAILLSSKTSNNAIVFPLYLYQTDHGGNQQLGIDNVRRPNFTDEFLNVARVSTGLAVVDGRGDLKKTLGVDDLLELIVATLHSPTYRSRYADHLSRDFPRLPLTKNLELLRSLVQFGSALIALQLLESNMLDKPTCEFVGNRVGDADDLTEACHQFLQLRDINKLCILERLNRIHRLTLT